MKHVVSSELKEALLRLRNDQKARVLFRHPCQLEVLFAHAPNWLERIQARLDECTYVPKTAPILSVPKPDWHPRPAAILTLDDQLVLHYLALLTASFVRDQISWSEPKIRYSHHLTNRGAAWFRPPFRGWKSFDSVSIATLRDSASYVLVTDIAGFYENIDIARLAQDLKAIGVSDDCADLLSSCLNKWAGPRGRGIPQGYSPSDLLAEFYLNSVDRALSSEGYRHLRYNDDIRLFASSKLEAIRGLHRLSELLRERGLNLQTAKTEILDTDTAVDRFSTVSRLLFEVSQRIGSQIGALVASDPYISPGVLRAYLRSDPDDPAPQIVEEAWAAFASGTLGGFNKSVFHYLLARLSEIESSAAVSFAVHLLRERPEETAFCLDYLAARLDDLDLATLTAISDVLVDRENVYEHQRYEIVRWFLENNVRNDRVLDFSRRQLGTQTRMRFVVPYAAIYLGTFGTDLSDFERLESAFYSDTDTISQGTYLYALRNAPKPIRSRVYSRAKGENEYLDWVLAMAKGETPKRTKTKKG